MTESIFPYPPIISEGRTRSNASRNSCSGGTPTGSTTHRRESVIEEPVVEEPDPGTRAIEEEKKEPEDNRAPLFYPYHHKVMAM